MASLLIIDGPGLGTEYELTPSRGESTSETVLGRDPRVDIPLEDNAVSREHCRIEASYTGFRLTDLDSRNRTYLNNDPVEACWLKDGDILNIDVTVIVDGWYGDNSRMYVAGKLSRKAERLINVTHDALMRGIEVVKPGNTFGDIGHAIQTFAESHRMSVVTDFCGHGVGRVFHAPPNVLHYGRPGTGAVLEPGMFFTIEPMVNLGRAETKVLADDWTAVTRDKSQSAQFEHSIGLTETGYEIFTESPAGMFHPTYSQG